MSEKVIKLVPLCDMPEESYLVVKCAADIRPEKIDWLWEERLPLGKCVLVAGEGGLGKSMLLAWIAAAVSRGKDWPCSEGKSCCGSVIILSAEDDAADTIVPRLMAADADCSKVHILEAVRKDDDKGQRSFNLQLDLPELEKTIEQLDDVLLVIIDPITSYLGKVDSHKNADIRSVLEPLGRMAAKRRVTVIANTHLSKAAGGSANSRVIGSVAFVNHARAAFIVTADPDDSTRRLFIPSKTNLGKPRSGLAYRIADTALPGPDYGSVIWAPYVKWEGAPVTISADQAMAALACGSEGRSAMEEAKQFLLDVLSEGQEGQKEIKRQAEEAGFHWRTVRRAKDMLGVEAIREGGIGESGRWAWRLTKKPKMSTSEFGHLSHLSRVESPKAPKVSNVQVGHLRQGYLDADAEERAAILEYDAGLTRAKAEAIVAEELPELPDFLRRVQ
jgi:putative DNA primase/helicase